MERRLTDCLEAFTYYNVMAQRAKSREHINVERAYNVIADAYLKRSSELTEN